MQGQRGAYALDSFVQTVRTGEIMDFQPWKNDKHSTAPTIEWEKAITDYLKKATKWVDKNLLLQE